MTVGKAIATTTAASGGNREELLGPRPAGHECNTLHEVDAGSRNSYAGVKRLRGLFYKQKDLLIKVKSQNKKIR